MLFLIWLALCLVALSLILLFPALWRRDIYNRYGGWRRVACPQDQQQADVAMDARYAVAAGMHGCPHLRLSDCSRWPDRAACDRACLSQAIHAAPYAAEVKVRTKPIHHLPIVLAAFAVWCLGILWHAQYLFRPQLTNALGLTRAQMRQMAWWTSPHLLTLAACLLFAYGVAWLLAVFHRKGVLPGVAIAVLLSGAVVAASWDGIARLPHDLLVIEASYAALAALAVGVIVGGFERRLIPRQ